MNDMEPTAKIPTATANGTVIDQNASPYGAAKSGPQTVIDTVGPTAAPDTLPTAASLTDAVNELAALREENAILRAELDDLKADFADTLADNDMMGRVFDADDIVKASMDEARRQKALADNAERTLAARSQEFNERARNVIYWKNRAEKAEKQLLKVA